MIKERSFVMKVVAFNGSPRKKDWNTVTLLENALKGAMSVGAETELVQLYDLRLSGCISCFSCKKISRKENGVCAVQDELTPVLDRIKEADSLIIGTPVYYGAESASTRAFMERLRFPYNNYSKDFTCLFFNDTATTEIYTMNVAEEMIESFGYDRMFGHTKTLMA
jgi:multimeric flavodoxin WrbA